MCVSQLEDELGADGKRLVQLREGSVGWILPRLSHTYCDHELVLTYTQQGYDAWGWNWGQGLLVLTL